MSRSARIAENRGQGDAGTGRDGSAYQRFVLTTVDFKNGRASHLMGHISSYKELRVYKAAMDAAMRIFEISKHFPAEERYSLTDQIRRASRSVCSNIGESWRKRRYRASFISKLSDSETEAEETRVWLEISWRCQYISEVEARSLDHEYDRILAQLVAMIDRPDPWLIKRGKFSKGKHPL